MSAQYSPLSPLRHPVFRAVWITSTLSNLGGIIQSVGASWMMLSISQSASMVALVQTSVALPIMLLALVAGAVADNVDRRHVMIGAQVFVLVVSVTLAACAWTGLITPWLLLLFTFLIGCGAAFHGPAWQASVGDMMPRAQLPGAVALNSMGFNIARSLGPAIGGAIVAAAGAAAAFAANAATYVPLIIVLARWKPLQVAQVLPRETLGMAVATGLRYVAMSPAILAVLARAAVFGVAASSVMALLPLIAKHLVGGGPLTYGLLLGAFGVGAIAGAVGNARLRGRVTSEVVVRIASTGFAVGAAIAAVSTHLLVMMAVLLLAGAGWLLAFSTFNVAVQMSAPRWVVARALSLYQMVAFGGIAVGSWLWGVVAARLSLEVSLLAAAAVMLVCAVLGRWLPLTHSEDLNLDPLRQWTEPRTAVAVEARTGPVVVSIEYIICEEDGTEFLAAMAERRRIRRRDGARNWRLLRDLGDPQIWIERYETPTWVDYVRHNSRITQNDAVVPQRLRALHRGPEPPRVRRMLERQPASVPTSPAAELHGLVEPVVDSTRSP